MMDAFEKRLAEYPNEDLRALDGIVNRVHAERAGQHPLDLPGTQLSNEPDDFSNQDFLILAGLQIGANNLAVFSSLADTRPHPHNVPQEAGIDYWAVFTLLGWGRTIRRGRLTKNGWTDIINESEPFVLPVTTEGIFALAFLRTVGNITGKCVRLR
ncbi:MAG: hypothetical protein GXP06_13890 [Alphaproteobacteria bacterium]|nr:hypothetical protein [Alphaproteobacteria bacterium]